MNGQFRAVLIVATVVLVSLGCDREVRGNAERNMKAEAVALCREHQLAETDCPFCRPMLIETKGFCVGHGVPEALCYRCNPSLIPAFQTIGDWCTEHERPESQCGICNPPSEPSPATVPGEALEGARSEIPLGTETVRDSSLPRRQAKPSTRCRTEELIVRFENPETAERAGFEFAVVERRSLTETVECNAEIAYNSDRYARISAQMPGLVAEIHKDFGDTLKSGDGLVTITSTRLAEAQAAYLQAGAAAILWKRNHARETDLLLQGVSTEKDLLDSEARLRESQIALSESEQALRSFGLSESQIEHIRRTGETNASYIVTAPFDGIVVDRRIALGETVNPAEPLYCIADVSRMWALLDVYETDLRHVRIGQPVILRVDGLEGEPFAGAISWISTDVDPKTRTLRARAALENTSGLLRANMFGQAVVLVREHHRSLVVPTASVQWEGCCNIVFVRRSQTVYEPRKVRLGVASGAVFEVEEGVEEGEEVVTQGSFLLKTEILKGSIGAGCCEVDPGA